MSKVFLDTNILVYALDNHDPVKRDLCRGILRKAAEDTAGVISTQVLQEFYVTATRKLGVDAVKAREIVRTFENLETVQITPGLVYEAIDCSILYRISFWDALIIAAAEAASCESILTEDLSHGQTVRGVRIENPFS